MQLKKKNRFEAIPAVLFSTLEYMSVVEML